ncbi:Efflux protein, LysE family [Pseudomonas tremae]|uniref:Efflux protein, LysE family n=2 Tax=Pseudomonas TaxID=286 RepID=A0AA40P400_9PSED|nr:Efflux protein, LysE family [Pseudomonas coronafaciens pv. garcae]KPZ00341.1 Efflux protein, LysE family [Pseudomonas tremae]RMO06063.1 Efflux protein, LysE family [Pseudomonas coronafaciens pv. zizaniae]RMS88072.1 Efflux protein, LysE family [Pseudomonas coronafaciens pv. oryzae]RMS99443.1 Efflux protein, LysE family [Pseudomonas coronafaciens pv. oryzae]
MYLARRMTETGSRVISFNTLCVAAITLIRSFLIVFEEFSMSLLVSMAAFALASSITPGPVNIVALSAGASFGFWPGMRHVLGATLGFTLLLLLIGFGLHETLQQWPFLTRIIQGAGVAFLLYMAFRLVTDNGLLSLGQQGTGPSMIQGAVMQWLNPKAWLASIAGMGVFVANGEAVLVWQFAAIYCVVCYVSLGCWAFAGSFLSHYLRNAASVRAFNRFMGLLLIGCAFYLVI